MALTPDTTIHVTLKRDYNGWSLKVEAPVEGSQHRKVLVEEKKMGPGRVMKVAGRLGFEVEELVRERFRADAIRAEEKLVEATERFDKDARHRREEMQRLAVETDEARRIAAEYAPVPAAEPF